MKIIVFGAAGRTGVQICARALEAGHHVTAFVRKPELFPLVHPNLVLIQGDVVEKTKVESVIPGNEILISALGVKDIQSDQVNLMSEAMNVFLPIAQKNGVKRVFAIGGMGVLQADDQHKIMETPNFLPVYKKVSEGHLKVLQLLEKSGVNWTFVCCPDILDGPETGAFTVKKDYFPHVSYEINTADIASFILKEIEVEEYLNCKLGICSNIPS